MKHPKNCVKRPFGTPILTENPMNENAKNKKFK